jgi:hypothetical protein
VGPVVLITIGVLFLIDQLADISFWHTSWPALLIVIGLIMFLQHNASAEGHVPVDYRAMAQRGRPGPPMPPYPPQPPVVTPPPVPPASPITPETNWKNPNDSEVRNGQPE